jgi:hypothetical protein
VILPVEVFVHLFHLLDLGSGHLLAARRVNPWGVRVVRGVIYAPAVFQFAPQRKSQAPHAFRWQMTPLDPPKRSMLLN